MRLSFPIQDRIHAWLVESGFPRDWFLIPLAAMIGVLAGVLATAFHALVRLSEHYFGRLSQPDLSRINWELLLLIPVPALGGLAVGCINHYIARSAPGHGIPDVIEALARQRGVLRKRTGVFRAITSALTIGSGGSAGQEGPIVQIGSVLGSAVGQVLAVGREHMNTLVGCGAAAGLAALFNAPIAGVLFVLEVMLRDFSLKTFVPIVIAGVLGVATAQALVTSGIDVLPLPEAMLHPTAPSRTALATEAAAGTVTGAPPTAQEVRQSGAIFTVPPTLHRFPFQFKEILSYAVLGGLCGFVGFGFTRTLYRFEHQWQRSRMHPALRPAVGGAVLGVLGVLFVFAFRMSAPNYELPPFFANGYPVIQWLFDPATYLGRGDPGLLKLLLFLLAALACKVVGTSITLGSGGSGGVFAPSLFMGATLGGAFGILVRSLPGFHGITPAHYALVGMAGVLAGSVHCPLTAFLLVFEITSDYKLILPVMLVAVLATTIAQVLLRDSIYTLALRERGIRLGALSDLTILRRIEVGRVPLAQAVIVRPEEPAQRLVDLAQSSPVSDYVVCAPDKVYAGMVVGDDLRYALLEREAIPLMIVAELMRADLPAVTADETLEAVLNKFARYDIASLAVVDEIHQVTGVITRAALMRQYQAELEEAT
ncbi:MAG: chloride channel protein [Phycisphaeraceae bacterium]